MPGGEKGPARVEVSVTKLGDRRTRRSGAGVAGQVVLVLRGRWDWGLPLAALTIMSAVTGTRLNA